MTNPYTEDDLIEQPVVAASGGQEGQRIMKRINGCATSVCSWLMGGEIEVG
ncbi:MAG: hypothetical protein NT121_04250 [Chloroflexi bacterium]|nr:hypothetical protein [Chloroflexota bacterium]